MIPHTHIQSSPLDVSAMREAARAAKSGAVVVFEGCARDYSEGREVALLSYEAYEPMALEQLKKMRQDAMQRFHLDGCFIHHRLGEVPLAEAAVAIVCSSSHRRESLTAVTWLLDELKAKVPIWKREHFLDGGAEWG